MKTLLYRMDCLTNMHVGSGDVNYSIIDNEIEKDPVLKNVAVIHPSGVKGALKEYFGSAGVDEKIINYIFGNGISINDRENSTNTSKVKKTVPGNYKFMGATLMARPLRVSDGAASYILTSSDELLNQQMNLFRALNIKSINGKSIENFSVNINKDVIVVSNTDEVKSIEGKNVTAFNKLQNRDVLTELIGPSFAIASADFLGTQDYPFIARNCLDSNGISQNLWYEEVVPHESVFYFAVMAENEYLDEFKAVMENVIQFGGNASIGYGFAKVHCVAESPEVL